MAAASGYDAFISYSHQHDGVLAPALQTALERFAKPWYRVRALRVFRDQANLGANPHLWDSVEAALKSSEWFVLLASRQAAGSEWVNREVAWWLANRPRDRMLIVATDPGMAWDESRGDWAAGAPVPPALRGAFDGEPRWVDLTGVQPAGGRRPALAAEQTADVAAPIRKIDKDRLIGEHLRQHRRTMRLVRGAVTVLTALTAVSVLATVLAIGQRDDARAQATIATAGEVAALAQANLSTHLDVAQLLAAEAVELDNDPQSRAALFQAAAASPNLQRYLQVGSQVSALAASADGNIVVAGTTDGHLVRFDLATGSRTEVAAAGNGSVETVAVSADGSVVGAGDGEQAVMWDAGAGRPPVTFSPGGSVSSVAVSPLGKLIAVVSTPESAPGGTDTLTIRDTGSGGFQEHVAVSQGPNVAFPSESSVNVISGNGGFEELAASDLRVLSTSPFYGTPANDFTFGTSPNGAFSGYAKVGEVTEWPTVDAAHVGNSQLIGVAPFEEPSFLAFSDDGRQAASIDNGTITVSPLAIYSGASAGGSPVQLTASADTTAVTFLGSDHQLVSAAGDTLALWNLQKAVQLGQPTGVSITAYQVVASAVTMSMSPDGRYLAIGNPNLNGAEATASASNSGATFPQTVSVYRNGSTLTPVSVWHQNGTPMWDGDQLLLVGTAGNRVQITQAGGHVLQSWPTDLARGGYGLFEPPGDTQIEMLAGGGLRSFNLANGTSTFQIEPISAEFSTELDAISPDEKGFASVETGGYPSSSSSTKVVYTDLQTKVSHVVGSGSAINVAFTDDRLLIQRASGVLEEWDVTGQHLLLTVPGIGNADSPLAVSPDGTMAARITSDGVLYLTDLGTGDVIGTLNLPTPENGQNAHPFDITTVDFSSDGRYMFTATPGGVLTRWDIGEQDLVRIACARAGSPLTPAIWAQYVHASPPANLACQGISGSPSVPAASSSASPAASPTESPSAGPSSSAAPSPTPSPSGTAAGPAAVVQAYINAINVRDYSRAWALGGKNLGATYSSFTAGYVGTSRDVLKISGVQGNVVTASLTAVQTNGVSKYYVGTYTVTDGTIIQYRIEPAG